MKNLALTTFFTVVVLFGTSYSQSKEDKQLFAAIDKMLSEEFKPAKTEIGTGLNTRKEIREITLSGTGYELGLQHGTLLKKEIGELVLKCKENIQKQMGRDPEKLLEEFFLYAGFEKSIKKWTPDLYEEIRGIAVGSGQKFNDIMLFSLLDEFWVYLDDLYFHHCSSVGVPASNGNPAYIAQNLDIESYTDGYQVLLRVKRNANQPEQLILTHPGCIALGGMNEAGIGACMNTLMQLKASSTGLPVAFVVRRILRSTDKKDLLDFIQTVPHASGQNYIVGIGEEVFDFEVSANQVVRYDPGNPNGTVYHTNHPLVNGDVKDWYKKYDPMANENLQKENSHVRLAAVQRRVAINEKVDDNLIKTVLRSKDDQNNPVCRNYDSKKGGFTFGSVIMTLSGKPFLQITAGPPDESEYKKVYFSEK